MDGKFIIGLGVGALVFVVAMILGVVLTDEMGYAARQQTTSVVAPITVATNNSLTNLNTTYSFVQDVTSCVNSSDAADSLTAANYTVIEGTSDGNGGFVLADTGVDFVGQNVNCTVTYLKETSGTTIAGVIMNIFVTIAGLAVIGFIYLIAKPIIHKNE